MMVPETSLVTGVDFIVVPTRDFDAALEFFGTVLRLPLSTRYGQARGAEFETGNLTLSVMESESFGLEFTPNKAGIALRVEDVDSARRDLESRGVQFVTQFDTGVCHQAIFHDPDGNAFILHHRYAPREA